MEINHLKDGVVAGMLLGDGHYHVRDKRIELCHTLPQFKYLKFKLGLAGRLGFNCRLFKLTKKRTTFGIYDYCSGTMSDIRYFSRLNMSLHGLLGELNSLGLLIWWLDDGCLSIHQKSNGSISRFGYLNTQNYTWEDNQIIAHNLYSKFGIESTTHQDTQNGKTYYRLYLNATNMRRLIDLVREFIPSIPSDMLYKLNMGYVVNRRKDSLMLATHYNF